MSTDIVVREGPILMSGAMVRAVLDGTKTQTRRVIPERALWRVLPYPDPAFFLDLVGDCRYGRVGDRLWCKETFARPENGGGRVAYQADGECGAWVGDGEGGRFWLRHGGVMHPSIGPRSDSWRGQSFGLMAFGGRWRPSIFMPRGLSRLTLEITGIRVERVQDITADDAEAEGVRSLDENFPLIEKRVPLVIHAYAYLWDKINKKRGYSWDSNPWVWVIEFAKVNT